MVDKSTFRVLYEVYSFRLYTQYSELRVLVSHFVTKDNKSQVVKLQPARSLSF